MSIKAVKNKKRWGKAGCFSALFRKGMIACVLAGSFLCAPVYADTQSMNEDLVRLVAGLDALLPIIADAESRQDPNAPVQFHFVDWRDAKGIKHNGLKEDVLAMRAGIVSQINQPVFAPRTLAPLANDYVSDTKQGLPVDTVNTSRASSDSAP